MIISPWDDYDPPELTEEEKAKLDESVKDMELDFVHIVKTDGSCVVSISGQGHIPCSVHVRKEESNDSSKP